MPKINIVFITGNEGKRKEVESILGNTNFEIINYGFDLPEIQTTEVEEVITEKINYAYNLINSNQKIFNEIKQKFLDKNITINNINDINIICEDTGLYIKNMNYFPGALIKFYYEKLGNNEIVKRDNGSECYVKCVIGVISGSKKNLVTGEIHGIIANKINSTGGFGWDPIFVPNLTNTEYVKYNGQSYAEMPKEIKNKISHRYLACNNLKQLFEKHEGGRRKVKKTKKQSKRTSKKQSKRTSKKQSKKISKKQSKKISKKQSKRTSKKQSKIKK